MPFDQIPLILSLAPHHVSFNPHTHRVHDMIMFSVVPHSAFILARTLHPPISIICVFGSWAVCGSSFCGIRVGELGDLVVDSSLKNEPFDFVNLIHTLVSLIFVKQP